MSDEFDNKENEEREDSSYRMSFNRENREESNDDYGSNYNNLNNNNSYYGGSSNFDNNDDGGKKKGNKGPILGMIAAFLVLALIVGGLFGVSKLMGTDKEAKESSVAAESSEAGADKGSSSADKETEAASEAGSETTKANEYTMTTAGSVPTTQTVTATILDVSGVVEEVMPTIVAVTNTTIYSYNSSNYWNWYFGNNNSSSGDYTASGAGSGVIIAQSEDELMIATNAHVVLPTDYSSYGLTADSSEYSVKFCDDKEVTAYLKGYDEDSDLAVIIVKIADMDSETLNSIKVAAIGDSEALKVGNGVIAIGNALGFGQSVTVGYVSALNREVTISNITRSLIQTDAAINPGNSGGGLFDIYGRLIGINSAKYSSEEVEGIGYAIPINTAGEVLEKLMNEETVVREKVTDEDKMCYLGISASKQYSQAYDGQGAFVGGVVEGGPAETAGIMAYDIITAIGDTDITSWDELQNELAYHEGGEKVTVTYYTLQINGNRREYVEKTCEVTLGFRKDYQSSQE